MVWGLVRVTIFSAAFFFGLVAADFGRAPVSAKTGAIPQLDEKIGTMLIVACNDGTVRIQPLENPSAVQLNCIKSKMVVIRDHRESSEKIPEFRMIHNQLDF